MSPSSLPARTATSTTPSAGGELLAERMKALRAQLDGLDEMESAVELVVREAEAAEVARSAVSQEEGKDQSALRAAARAADEMQREMLVQALARITPALPHLGLKVPRIFNEGEEPVDIRLRPAERWLERLGRLRRGEVASVRRLWTLGYIMDPETGGRGWWAAPVAEGSAMGSLIAVDEAGVLWRLARNIKKDDVDMPRQLISNERARSLAGAWLFTARQSPGGVIDERMEAVRAWFAVGEAPQLDRAVVDLLRTLLQKRAQEAARQRAERQGEEGAGVEAEREEGPCTLMPRTPAR